MPKSQVRKKKVYTPPTDIRPAVDAARKKPSPTWVPVSAVALIVIGITWLVVYYLSGQQYPVEAWRTGTWRSASAAWWPRSASCPAGASARSEAPAPGLRGLSMPRRYSPAILELWLRLLWPMALFVPTTTPRSRGTRIALLVGNMGRPGQR